MRLCSLRDGGRDGTLIVANDDGTRGARGPVPTLREALEDWASVEPALRALSDEVDAGAGEPLDPHALHAPLPRAFQYCEGSTYLSHMERCRAARGAGLPPGHGKDPAVLQAGSDYFFAPTDPIPLGDVEWGLDVETTVAVIVDDVPQGTAVEEAAEHVKLVVLLNDLTLRTVLQIEYAKSIGFFQAKPSRVFAPFALTPDALGSLWDQHLLHATAQTWIRGGLIGELDTAADANFDFPQIIAHAAKTRRLAAGSIIGSGTVSNRDDARGFGCIAELRALEITNAGEPVTPWLAPGDTVHIEAFDDAGQSLFGAMDNVVVTPEGAA
jgi:fumarylacetoacetate (FAA) hydrolase